MEKLPVLDLFSGFGAYSLGLERTGGFSTVAFCEIEEYPRKILRKHWPDVPIFEDVRALNADVLRDAGIVPRWIVAGWPCQGNSPAGTGLGMDDPRSGLWAEIARLAGELGVEGLILENSSNLLAINGGRDFGLVLGDLAALGFDVEWHCLPAAAFDAPHIRDRVWIVAQRRGTAANDARYGETGRHAPAGAIGERTGKGSQPARAIDDAHASGVGRNARRTQSERQQRKAGPNSRSCDDADALREGLEGYRLAGGVPPQESISRIAGSASNSHGHPQIGAAIARRERHSWEPEPNVVRVVHGVANRVERIHGLGNLNPPIIPETIGRAILEARRAAV